MYLLDSCTISDFMKGHTNTMKKIKNTSPSLIYTMTITQTEIMFGLLRKFDNSHYYYKMFEDFLLAITVLPFDAKAAIQSAVIKKNLESRGNIIGAYDILIAGIAKAASLTLITSDIKEFERIDDLKLANWRDQ